MMNRDPFDLSIGRAIEVCQGSACREAGSDELVGRLEAMLGTKVGKVAAQGAISLFRSNCQGHCAIGPNARLDGRLVCGLTQDKAELLLKPQ